MPRKSMGHAPYLTLLTATNSVDSGISAQIADVSVSSSPQPQSSSAVIHSKGDKFLVDDDGLNTIHAQKQLDTSCDELIVGSNIECQTSTVVPWRQCDNPPDRGVQAQSAIGVDAKFGHSSHSLNFDSDSLHEPLVSIPLTERLLDASDTHQNNCDTAITWTSSLPGVGTRIRRSSSATRANDRHYHKLNRYKSDKYRRRNRRDMDDNKWIKCSCLALEKRHLAIIGAVLIHISLGTIYTLSNVNSYMTSYMRIHSEPTATYGGSMWFSSLAAVGQGLAMIFGGLIERRYSARCACIVGCLIHSLSIASTRWTITLGFVPTLITYGFLPGVGIGLAYLAPVTNGFGWFPRRKGMVAGIILAGFGIGTFIFNVVQTKFVNPLNLSPDDGAYFHQPEVLTRVPELFTLMGGIYGAMQFVGCCLLFRPPPSTLLLYDDGKNGLATDDQSLIFETELPLGKAIRSREFWVLYAVYGLTTQGVLFINAMGKEYGQIFIKDDMYLATIGSLASIANCLGRLFWGMAVDHFEFRTLFTLITSLFGVLMFFFPFQFVLASKLLYLICTLGIFGSFSGWMAIYPVFCSRTFGRTNSGIVYGLIFTSQSIGGVFTAFIVRELIDNYNRYVPCVCVFFLEIIGLALFHLFYPKR